MPLNSCAPCLNFIIAESSPSPPSSPVRGKPNRNTESWGKYVAPIRKYHGKPSSCHQKKTVPTSYPLVNIQKAIGKKI
jgi:hypothetical protein